jgi:hypothetical protein
VRTGRTQFAVPKAMSATLLSILGFALQAHAQETTDVSLFKLRNFVDETVAQSQISMDSWAVARRATDGGEDGSSGNRSAVLGYYQRSRTYYLADPVKSQRPKIVAAVQGYTTAVGNLVNEKFLEQAFKLVKPQPGPLVLKRIAACFRPKLGTPATQIDSTLGALQAGLSRSIARSGGADESAKLLGDNQQKFEAALSALELNVGEHAKSCCVAESLTEDGKHINQVDCDRLAFDVNQASSPAVKALNDKLALIPDVAEIPDPFRRSDLPAHQVAKLLPLYNVESLRGGDITNRSEVAGLESDMFSQAEAACLSAARKKQEDSNPIAKSIALTVAKGLKCAVFPTLATMYLDTEYQRLTTALGAAEIKGPGLDLSCDPREMELYNQMRPTDPNVISQQWGLQQLANPPYIDAMRRLPPLQSPFPILPAPGGGLITPYGNIGVTSQSLGLTSGVNASAASRSAVLPSAARRAVGAARSSPTGTRGLTAGRGLAQGARTLSSNISSGVRTRESVTSLRSGASNTRTLAKNILTNTSKLSVSERRLAASKSAKNAQTAVRALTGSTGSRTTAQGVLNGLKGRGGTGVAPDNSLDQTLEKKRKQMERLANSYIENIKTAQARAETARLKIIELIGQRDEISGKVLGDIINKPARTQAKRVEEARKRILEVDKQIGIIKAEYDVYSDSMLESASLIKQLAAFGTRAPNFGGAGGQNDPRNLNSSFPQAPPSSGRGRSTLIDIFEALLLPRTAWAIQPGFGQYADGQEWNAAYDTFVSRVEAYVELRRRDESTARTAAYKALMDRSSAITTANATDVDTEMLIAMDLYSDSLASESQDLIARVQKSQITLDSNEISDLGRIRTDALETQESIQGIYLLYKDTIPQTAEDNPEAWWGMVEDALLN